MKPEPNLAISCRQLCKSFQQGDQSIRVLDDLEFSLSAGEMVAILGQSGSGKSTLLNLIGGLDDPDSGEIWIRGERIDALNEDQRAELRNRHLGFVYQFHHLLPEFSALENVMMPLLMRSGKKLRDCRESATRLLEEVGLGHRLEHRPAALSGGERQRVAIARALSTSPACVLMDEPTGNLDSATAENVISLMMQLRLSVDTAFVIVTHDRQLADQMDSTYELSSGTLHRVTRTV